MKIVYVIKHPGQGGMEKHVYLLAKNAISSGHRVSFVFGEDGPLIERVKTLGCKTFTVKMRAPYDPVAVWNLVNLLKKLQPDVAHTHFMRENFLTVMASWFIGIPAMFTTIHRLEPKTWLQKSANRYFCKFLTKVIAVSPLAKQYILDEGINEGKIVTILNGSEAPAVDAKKVRANLGVKLDEKLLGYVGRFTPEKGHQVLLKAFALLNLPKTKLLLAGEGELLENTKALAKKLKVSDKVIFVPVIEDDKDLAYEFIAASDLYIQPSRIENLPTSVVEAMLYGVPAVASDCDAHKFLLKNGDFGYLFKNGNSKDLAKVIKEALTDPVSEEKTKAAKEYAELHLTAEKMWQNTEKLYQKYAVHGQSVLR